MSDRPLRATHHCRHYEYVRAAVDWGPKCASGIDLRSENVGALPCLPNHQGEPCAWREEYTDAERAVWEKWREERHLRMIACMALIPGNSRDKKNKPFWGQSGRFQCPACKSGMVRWVRARINGHVHAACSTPECFEVME